MKIIIEVSPKELVDLILQLQGKKPKIDHEGPF